MVWVFADALWGQIIVAVEIHRLDRAVVTTNAELLAVAVAAVLLVVLSDELVRCSKIQVVIVSTKHTRRLELARVVLGPDKSTGVRQVAGGARIRRRTAVMA